MRQITVKQEYSFFGQPVCVVVEGFCNHFDTTTELRDLGRPDQIKGDYVDDWRDTTICARCGVTYNEYDERWEDI